MAIVAFFFLPHGDLTELFGRTQAPHVASTNPGSHDSLPLTSAPTAQALRALQVFVSGATVLVATLFLVRGMTGIRSHLLVELLQLNIALLFLGGFLWFYSRLSLAGEKTVWAQAALLVILKVWDLLISGKDVTNVNGRVFQRRFLLLLYLGYIMFVSTAILHFSSQQLADTTLGIDRFFEAETLLRQGILWLGSPLLLVGFFFRIRRLMSPTRYLDDAVSNQSSA